MRTLQSAVICAAVVLTACGKEEPAPPDAAALRAAQVRLRRNLIAAAVPNAADAA